MITTFIRSKLCDSKLYGFVVNESDSLILLALESDFQFNGFKVIRKNDVNLREISNANKYCCKIMKKEGAWVKPPTWVKRLDLTNWKSLIGGLKTDVAILQNEKLEGGFYIGPIVKLEEKSVEIGWFDAEGKWGSSEKVNYSMITSIKFLDRYSSIHAKYLKWT